MARLWRYVGRYRLRYVGGIACLVGATSLDMMVPRLLGRSLDAIETDAGARVLLTYLGLIVAITVLQGLVRTFSRFVIFNVGRDIEYDLRNDLFRHLAALSPDYYGRTRTGDIMARATNDLNAVRQMLGPGMMYCFGLPQPPVGSSWKRTLRMRISQMATTKFGTVRPSVAPKVTR